MKNTKLISITKACKITDQIFSKLIKNIKSLYTEKEIANFILKETKKRNRTPAFPPIVASGKNASNPHHEPKKELNKGFCVIDFGVRVNKFCSDMTRTIFIGKPTKQELNIYNLVLNSQTKTIKLVKPDIKTKHLAQYSRKLLKTKEKLMIHGLGHGVGKHIHINPRISTKSNHILKDTDIITIEPGIYKKNKYGIRIEDTLTTTGKILTKSTKKLIIITLHKN